MEQPNKPKKTFTFLHAAGLLLILCAAAVIWFGIHPRYRFLSFGVLAVAALAAWKRNWMFWLALAVQAGLVVFLWTFPQSGYHITSIVPLTIIGMMLIFRFCKKPVRIAASIIVGTAALALLIVEIPIVKAAVEKPEQDAPYVVVLGAGVYGEEPSVTLTHRLEGAVRYLNANPNAKAVVSGGQGEGEDITEAECMRRYLTAHGIADDRILIEDRSTSTKENLAFSMAVIEANGGDASRIAIVSSRYHLYRAKKTASMLGMDAVGVAGSDGYPIYVFGMYLREALAVVRLWVFRA